MNSKTTHIENENHLLKCENQQLKMKIMELENKVIELQMQQTQGKHNSRNAGRKEYGDKDTVRRIFLLYARGKTFQEIADTLNLEGIPTKAGGTWAKSSVRYIFNNEIYVTKRVMTKKEFELNFT